MRSETAPVDGLFVITNTTLAPPFAEQLGCEVEARPFGLVIKMNSLKETSVPGVFTAGDAARTIHNTMWAAADGVSAEIFAHQSLIVVDNPSYHRGK